ASVDPGQSVVFTVNVSSNGMMPVGIVTLREGMNLLATASLQNGRASLTLSASALTPGPHSIVGLFEGGTDGTYYFAKSTAGAVALTVLMTPTVSMTQPSSTIVVGQPTTFSATVSGNTATPTGSVQFDVDGVSFGSAV